MRSMLFVTMLATSAVAFADPAGDAAKSDSLFEEGRKLRDAGDLKGACGKFEQALEKNHNAVGTILNVALCDAEAGKVATAYKLFTEARDRAAEQNLEEHRKAAVEQMAKLESKVPVLAIAFAEKPPLNAKLVVDDQIVAIDKSDNIPIDPGTRTIVMTAPGRVPYEAKIMIVVGKPMAISVPKLGYPVTVKKARKTVGKILTFGGGGLAATGLTLGLVARAQYRDQFQAHGTTDANCTSPAAGSTAPAMCNPTGQSNVHSARTLGTVGTVVGIGGLAAVGLGAFLWFWAPAEPAEHADPSVSVIPTLGPDQAGLAAFGRF